MRYILVGEAYEGWARLDTLAQAAKPFAGITTQSLDMAMVFGENVLDYGALYEARTLAEQTLDPPRPIASGRHFRRHAAMADVRPAPGGAGRRPLYTKRSLNRPTFESCATSTLQSCVRAPMSTARSSIFPCYPA